MIVISKPEMWPIKLYPKVENETELVLSHYAIVVEYEDGYLLHHTITWSIFYFSKEEYENIFTNEKMKMIKVVLDKSIDEDEVAEKVYLKRSEYPKPFTFDSLRGCVLMTTTACNARCHYCYEKGILPVGMTIPVAEKVAKFLAERATDKKMKIQWFGGEPLLNTRVMDYITKYLEDSGVTVTSSMISNGYLLNEENVEKMEKVWHMNFVQITIDGPKDTYNAIKNFKVKDANPFDTVIGNIKRVLEKTNVKIAIRINACEENIDELDELLSFISTEFKDELQTKKKNRIMVDFAQIYQLASNIYGEYPEGFEEKYDALKKKYSSIIKGRNHVTLIKKTNLQFCGADAGHMVVIHPSGQLGPCEHWTDKEIMGDVENGITNPEIPEAWRIKGGSNLDYCKKMKCPMIPSCKRSTKCPSGQFCQSEKKFNLMLRWKKESIIKTFEDYLFRVSTGEKIRLIEPRDNGQEEIDRTCI